jgi:polar amino acid transport system substrate-binding protein
MKKFAILAAVLAAALALASCGAPTDALSKIKAAGKLVVGTSADYAPYEFHTLLDGQDAIVGFDMAIAAEIAKDLGVKLEIQDIGFDGLLQALNSDKVDIVISGMTPTEERKKSVDFSEIYYMAKQTILVRTEDVATYTIIDSLKGKKVGAQLASIQEGLVKDKIPEAVPVSLGKIPDLILELKGKKIDALVVELPVANGYITANPDLALSDITIGDPDGGSAVAIKQGNKALVDAINATLKRLAADGSIDKFVAAANELNVPKQ